MSEVSTATLHSRADGAAAAGNFSEALAASAEVIRASPHDHRARLKVGLSLSMLGRPTEALQTLRAAAVGLADRGFMLAAIGACRDALGLAPDDPSILELLRSLHGRIHGVEGSGRARVPPPIPPVQVDTAAGDALSGRSSEVLIEAIVPFAVEPPSAPPDTKADLTDHHVPLFSELPQTAFTSLVGQMGYLKVPAQHEIVRQGHPGTSVYILLEGEVQVVRRGDDGPQALARLSGGALFGEMAILTDKPRQATVITTQPSELFEIDRKTIESIAAEHPQVAEDIVAFARRRLLVNVMATSPMFQPLDDRERIEMLKAFRPEVVDAGASLIREGQSPEALYVVVEGDVEVSKVDSGGDRVVLAYLKAGAVFGEIGLLEDQPATADVRTVEKSVVLRLDRDKFTTFAEAHPALVDVLKALSKTRRQELDAAMADGIVLDADDLIIV